MFWHRRKEREQLIRGSVREAWGWSSLERLSQDLRYAARLLRRSPEFTATAVLSLALGIGANTAIYSILHALVLRSLPVADPDRLVVVTRNQNSFPYPLFVELRDRAQTLDGVLTFRTNPVRFSAGEETERITVALVSGTYFDVLGVRTPIGTAIGKDDDIKPGSGGWRGPVVVISHNFWQRRFGGHSSVIGMRILLNGRPFTVAGVGPAGFEGTEVGESPDVYAPMAMQQVLMGGLGNALAQPRSNWVRILGRLKPGMAVEKAEAELNTILRQYNEAIAQDPETNKFGAVWRRNLLNQRVTLLPGGTGISRLRQDYAKPLWVLMAIMGLVLLIACANVANLLLSRAAARRREFAIRLGLGAARRRLILQLLLESLLLASIGAGCGLFLARLLRDVLLQFLPPERNLSVPLDLHALLFTLALAIGSALLFGLWPAFQSTRVDVAPALKGEEGGGRSLRGIFRQGLVVFQISLSLLLLTGAALFLRSLQNLLAIDPGFARENVLMASMEADRNTLDKVMERVKQLPGVVSAGFADSSPLRFNTGWTVYVPGFVPKPNHPSESPVVGSVSPGYFATMNLPLLVGRDFEARDSSAGRNVGVVNETFARHYFAGENPVGRRFGTIEGVYDFEIIGVVKDGRYTGLRETDQPMIYVPQRSRPETIVHSVLHVRTAGNPMAMAATLRTLVREINKQAPIFNIHTVREEVDRSLLRERLVGVLSALFGGLALLLSALGLYGLLSYGVAGRTREFGIRVAIGATAGRIERLVLREAIGLLLAGIVVGLGAAWGLGQVVGSLLFGVTATDPGSAGTAVSVLAVVALLAAYLPARRAAKVEPTQALRHQ